MESSDIEEGEGMGAANKKRYLLGTRNLLCVFHKVTWYCEMAANLLQLFYLLQIEPALTSLFSSAP